MSALSSLFASSPHRASSHPAAPLDLPALVGVAGWSRLPAAVRRRFDGHAQASYVGHMDLHCSLIGRLYAAVAAFFGGPLSAANARAVAATVRVHDNGRGGVVWERCFHQRGGAAERIVRSTKQLDAAGALMERTDGGLSMSLDVFEEDGTLVFLSRRFWLVRGGFRLPVPALLTPGTCRVTHTDLGGGCFRFTLSMVHPLWGATFRQTGVFVDPHAESVE